MEVVMERPRVGIYKVYVPGAPKTHFFLVIRLRLFFWVITAMHFVQANVAIYVFFSTFRYACFQQNVEKLWLCYAFGFGTKAIYGHICPYMAIYDQFFWSS